MQKRYFIGMAPAPPAPATQAAARPDPAQAGTERAGSESALEDSGLAAAAFLRALATGNGKAFEWIAPGYDREKHGELALLRTTSKVAEATIKAVYADQDNACAITSYFTVTGKDAMALGIRLVHSPNGWRVREVAALDHSTNGFDRYVETFKTEVPQAAGGARHVPAPQAAAAPAAPPADWIQGIWIRLNHNRAAGAPFEIMQLNADGTWACASFHGTPETPTAGAILARGDQWEVTSPLSASTTDTSPRATFEASGLTSRRFILGLKRPGQSSFVGLGDEAESIGNNAFFAGELRGGKLWVTAEYHRANPSQRKNLEQSLANASADPSGAASSAPPAERVGK